MKDPLEKAEEKFSAFIGASVDRLQPMGRFLKKTFIGNVFQTAR